MAGLDTPTGNGTHRQVDPDLTGSCIGLGIMYPQIWEVVRRYILRGDDNYQAGGLWILSSLARNLPLQEAADTLEAYFSQHDFVPMGGGRPGIMLSALAAAYAVGTNPGWFDDNVEERRAQMRTLLETCLTRFNADARFADMLFAPDREAVRETIEAIRTDRAGFQPRLTDGSDAMSPEKPSDHDPHASGLDPAAGVTLAAVETILSSRIAQLREELEPTQLSQMDVVIAKHSHELLSQRLGQFEGKFGDAIAGVQRDIDRYVAGRQLTTGQTQVTVGRVSLVIGGLALLVAVCALLLSLL